MAAGSWRKMSAAMVNGQDETGSLFDGRLDWPRQDTASEAFESYCLTGSEEFSDFWENETGERRFGFDSLEYAVAEARIYPDPIAEIIAAYPKTIQGKLDLHAARARERGRVADLTERQWVRIVAAFGGRCAYCGRSPRVPVIEHVVPLARGGHHTRWNVLPSCQGCNIEKGARTLLQWQGGEAFWLQFLPRVERALAAIGGAR